MYWFFRAARQPDRGWRWLCIICLCLVPICSQAADWQEYSSTHFRVLSHHDSARSDTDVAFVRQVMTYAEHYYQHIALGLGLTEVMKRDRVAWLGRHRCQIYLYANKQAYTEATGAPPWSGGFAVYSRRAVWSFVGAETFLNSTLPHELAHIVFREYVGFVNPHVPRWLDEGVAEYAAVGRLERALARMPQLLMQGVALPLWDLTQMQVEHADTATVQVFYLQAATLVHFVLDTYGTQGFIALCDALRDGEMLEDALASATGGQVRSLTVLENDWRAFILNLP